MISFPYLYLLLLLLFDPHAVSTIRPLIDVIVFETELLAIEGVKAPEKPVEKPTEEPVVEKVAEKVASVAAEAADAAKTILSDTDDTSETHEEL
jgi:FK506-binding protein 2